MGTVKLKKFKTYKSIEYGENKAARRDRQIQTERVSYEEFVQESFFRAQKKARSDGDR